MLTFVLKKKWFRMISSGEKKEKYCEINPYYTSKFRKIVRGNFGDFKQIGKKDFPLGSIKFKSGYSSHAFVILAECYLTVGTGKKEWGAKEGKIYYILKIKDYRDVTFAEIYWNGICKMIPGVFLIGLFSEVSDGCRKIPQYFLKKSKK